MSSPPDKIFNLSRTVTLLGSILVGLGSGTSYIYSAYAPQLGARLRLSHTQLNIIGLAGHMGGSISGPILGRLVDHKGPQMALIGASIFLLFGYLGIKQTFDAGVGEGSSLSAIHFTLLIVCNLMTGLGSSSGIGAAINTTAKSFPSSFRATATGIVLSGLGLSAFFFSLLGRTFFPGDSSALLFILGIGTASAMLLGVLTVKQVPLPSTSSSLNGKVGLDIEDDDPVVCIGEAQMILDPDVDAEADADCIPLLPQGQETSGCEIPMSPSDIELGPSGSLYRKRSGKDYQDVLPDIHGKRLWLTRDFYLLFVIIGICSGTGIMYINNVGAISQALYAKTNSVYDEIEASKWQTAQVSILSLGNCAGRVLIGLFSDFTHTRLHLPRVYCLCVVSSLFIISQMTAIAVSSIDTLWIATILLGIAYGSLWGSAPATVIEWFGLAHFSENFGYVCFSPIIGGNVFSLIFGRNLDAHAQVQDASPSLLARFLSSAALVPRAGLASEHQCFDGKACYVGSLRVTLAACAMALGLSLWAGIRDGRKVMARNGRT